MPHACSDHLAMTARSPGMRRILRIRLNTEKTGPWSTSHMSQEGQREGFAAPEQGSREIEPTS